MPPTARGRVRPGPTIFPTKRRELAHLVDSDNEARYIVTVLSAKNLKRQGFRGLTNPYCQLNVGRQGPFNTDVVLDSSNPSWEKKLQAFEFREATGPHQDKLSLACFNSGDVPELIGRLSVALSPTTHKVISLPMFRKDLRGSQVWAGSVEIELHYIPDCQAIAPPIGGRGVLSEGGLASKSSLPPSPTSPSRNSLTSLFAKTPPLLVPAEVSPKMTPEVSIDDDRTELLALSPRTEKGAEVAAAALLVRDNEIESIDNVGGCNSSGSSKPKDGRNSKSGAITEMALLSSKDTGSGSSSRYGFGSDGAGGGGCRAFFAGVLCSAVLVLGGLCALGDSLCSGGLSISVLEEKEGRRQTLIVIDALKLPQFADRHLVVFVGDQELCRAGLPAPSPPTEGSSWAYDLSSQELAREAATATCGNVRVGCGGGEAGIEKEVLSACGRWCSFFRWQGNFIRRLAAPLYAARHGGHGGGGGGGDGS